MHIDTLRKFIEETNQESENLLLQKIRLGGWKKKLYNLSSIKKTKLINRIDAMFSSLEPITNQLVNPRFCLTLNKQRFTTAYEMAYYSQKNKKSKKKYKLEDKPIIISTPIEVLIATLKSNVKTYSKINIGLHSWNQNQAGDKLIFIDVDHKDALKEERAGNFLKALQAEFNLNNPLIQQTPSGGYHLPLFVKSDKQLKNCYGMQPNVDIICRPQSYVLAAGSTTDKGTYKILQNGTIPTIEWKDIPQVVTTAWTRVVDDGIQPSSTTNNLTSTTYTLSTCNIVGHNRINSAGNVIYEEGLNPKHKQNNSKVIHHKLSTKTKQKFDYCFAKGIQVHQGDRINFIRHIATKFLGEYNFVTGSKFQEVVHLLNEKYCYPTLEQNDPKFVDLLVNYQGWFYKNRKFTKAAITTGFEQARQTIVEILSTLPKEENKWLKVESQMVDAIIQKCLESLVGKPFKKDLPHGVTPELLKASGFEKRKERIGKTTYYYYNVSTDSLTTLYNHCVVGVVDTTPTHILPSPSTISTCNIVGHNRIPTAVESTLASNPESEVNQISSNVVTTNSCEGPVGRATSEPTGQAPITTTSVAQQEPIQINENAPESNPMTKNAQLPIQEPTSPNEAYTASQNQPEESIKEIAATLSKEQIEEIFKQPKTRIEFFQLIDEETFDRLTTIQKSNCPPAYRNKFSWFNRKK